MLEKFRQSISKYQGKLKKDFQKAGVKNLIISRRFNLIRKVKIRQRLIISFLVISIVPLLVLGIASFNSARSLVSDIIKQYTEQIVVQFGNNVSSEFSKIVETSNSFIFSTLLQKSFNNYDELEMVDRIDAHNNIKSEMNIISSQNSNILEVRLITPKNTAIYVGVASNSTDYNELNQNFTDSGEAYKWYINNTDIIYARKVVNISTSKWIGNYFITLNNLKINQRFDSLKLGDKVELLFLTEDGTILYSTDQSKSPGTIYP